MNLQGAMTVSLIHVQSTIVHVSARSKPSIRMFFDYFVALVENDSLS